MNDDVSLEDLQDKEYVSENDELDENVELGEDDDMGKNAEDMGVITSEEDEVDITRIPYQSDITHSPPPEAGMPDIDDEENELDEPDEITDLETDVELNR